MANGRIIIDVLLDAADAIKSTGKVKDAFVGMGKVLAGAAVMGAGAIAGIVESTAELNQDLARLKANANSAGFGFEVMEDGMKKVAAVTGEMDSAVETMSNLMATDFSENQLSEALDYINGAAIKFSDTLKTEGIADGLQETFATGEAIGMFGELLERSGVDLDVFNKGLAQAAKNGTETDYVLKQLSELGLSSVYDEYKNANPEIFAYNEASTNLQVALAELGKTFTPLVTGSKQFLTSIIDLINGNQTLDQVIDDLVIKFANMLSAMTGIDASVFINAFNTVKTTVMGIMDTIEGYIASGLARIKGYWSSEGDGLIATVHSKLTEMQAVVLPIVQGVIDTLANLFRSVQAVWERDGQAIIERLVAIFNSVKAIVVPIVQDAIRLIIDNFAKIKEFWDSNGEQILQAVTNIFQGILAVIEFVMPAVQFVIEYVWNAIKNVITGALDVIMGAVKVFSGLFTGDFEKMWEGIKQIFSGAIDLIFGLMSLSFVGGIRNLIVNFSKTVVNLFKTKWTSIVDIFKNFTGSISSTVNAWISKILGFIRNLATNFTNTITTLRTNVINQFNSLATGMINKVKGLPQQFLSIGKSIMQGLINGLKSLNPIKAIGDIASQIKNTVASAFEINSPSKWMRDEIVGKGLTGGFEVGIDKNAPKMLKAAAEMGELLKPDLKLVNPLRNAKLDLGLDKPSPSTSTISNVYNNYGQQADAPQVIVKPASVYLGTREVADIIFEDVSVNQSNSMSIKKLVKGVQPV